MSASLNPRGRAQRSLIMPPPTTARPTISHPLTAAERLAEMIATTQGEICVIIDVDREWATAALTRNTNNRNALVHVVDKYSRAMAEGRWTLTWECIMFDKNGVLRNGQHRLLAVIQSGVTVPFRVVFNCTEEEITNIDGCVYRDAGHILQMRGMPNAAQAAALTRNIMMVDEQDPRSIFDRRLIVVQTETLYKHDPHFDPAIRAAQGIRKLLSQTAAGLAYYEISRKTKKPENLPVFWEGASVGANLPARSPILRLRAHLLENAHKPGAHARDLRIRMAAFVILTWNAWHERRMPSFKWEHAVKLPPVL